MKANSLFSLVEARKAGRPIGIPSYCTANPLAIEAVLAQAKAKGCEVLVEGTSNQVNQFGGYTGMKAADYRDFVYAIADKVGLDRSKLILGGDHLGPQPFQNLNADVAMDYAEEMVRSYVLAGYTKIHLDTSMRVADDDHNARLSDQTIARRGARLMKASEEAYQQLLKENPEAVHPVFIIGSEVPIPGGAQVEEAMHVTSPADFEATVKAYKEEFAAAGIADLWQHVIAVVVQPGVEFADADVHDYVRSEAAELTASLAKFPELVFEGHSTDYQTADSLNQMVEDGVAILKVGPALTYAVREALFALSHIEDELLEDGEERSDFRNVVEQVMVENPGNWAKYYHGDAKTLQLKRAYSYSDRSRYYMGNPRIVAAQEKLMANLSGREIPMGLLHQYFPLQYIRIRDHKLANDPRALVLDSVRAVCYYYNAACGIE